MGVRISWLTLARNSSLARFADSAASLARRSSSSARFWRVMSRFKPSIKRREPSAANTPWPRAQIHRTVPSLCRTRCSASYILRSRRAFKTPSRVAGRSSGNIISA